MEYKYNINVLVSEVALSYLKMYPVCERTLSIKKIYASGLSDSISL